jgi:hypothetical protein
MSTNDPNDPRRPAAIPIPGSPAANPTASASVAMPGARAVARAPSLAPGAPPTAAESSQPPTDEAKKEERFPREPKTWHDLGLDPILGEELILKYLLNMPSASVRELTQELCIALQLIKEQSESLRGKKLIAMTGTNQVGEPSYGLSEAGRVKAQEARSICAYVGPAPVLYEHWIRTVKAQSLSLKAPGPEDMQRAFADLSLSEDMIDAIGPAINGSKSMFLYGAPGNGKTSLAERMTRCFGDSIWIPHCILIDGHFVKMFDAVYHEKLEFNPPNPNEKVDRRYLKIKRPTVIAGGELTLDMLEIQHDPISHVNEAPLQMKANCGTFVIDDFGRQRTSPREILNRWIFPLEKRIDFLKLPDGRKIAVPFDGLLIFSTNLEPRDLADEAFLRRIPYKIQVHDPSEEEFRTIIEAIAAKMRVQLPRGSLQYLIDRHYRFLGQTPARAPRPFRFCHPRDLLLQVQNLCSFQRRPAIAGPPEWDKAVSNYFAIMGEANVKKFDAGVEIVEKLDELAKAVRGSA